MLPTPEALGMFRCNIVEDRLFRAARIFRLRQTSRSRTCVHRGTQIWGFAVHPEKGEQVSRPKRRARALEQTEEDVL